MQTSKIKLYNGVEIPSIGFGPGIMNYSPRYYQSPCSIWGTLAGRVVNKCVRRPIERFYFKPKQKRNFVAAIANSLKVGFRLLDYSCAYGNCACIADAIASSQVNRNAIFLTGRISNRAQFAGRNGVRQELDHMFEQYRTDYVDLLMFHWPVPGCYEETWRMICDLYESGKAKSIGVANCHLHHLDKLMKCGLKPMVNQFEVHPLFTQKELIAHCQDEDIVVESYTPIARMDDRLVRLPNLKEIAKRHRKTIVQIVLRWHIQNNCVPLVRSMNNARQQENFNVFDFELSQDEMRMIDAFNINSRLRYDPDNCDFTIL